MILREIAQKIVDSTMEVIDNRNINIMDCSGFIIASGEISRINTYHKGADDVIKSGAVIDIYPEDVSKYPGAKEGVNLPINTLGKIVGVVGVYGHPDEVRIVAKLVKNSVELMLEQHLVAEQVQLVSNLKQQLMRKLIYESVAGDEAEIRCLAKVVDIDIDQPRCAILLKLKDNPIPESYQLLKVMKQIEDFLVGSHFLKGNDFFAVINQEFAVFKTTPFTTGQDETAFLNRILQELGKQYGYDLKGAIGSHHAGLSGYRNSYQEAKLLIEGSERSVQNIADFEVQVKYLFSRIDGFILEHFMQPIYRRILAKEGADMTWMIQTLNALFDHNLNPGETAQSLYVHKNTVLYRIKKIEEISGLTITNFYQMILLKLLLFYMERLHKV
jgi:carbohydrate diacid regulator